MALTYNSSSTDTGTYTSCEDGEATPALDPEADRVIEANEAVGDLIAALAALGSETFESSLAGRSVRWP